MPAATLLEMRNRVRERTDTENQSNPSDTELTQLINTCYQEMYAKLIKHSLHKAESTQSITADGSAAYNLDAGMYSILGVWRVDGSGVPTRLERHDHRLLTTADITGPADSYRVIGATIEFYPRPSTDTYTIRYVPEPGVLSADGDEIDGVLGWEEYVVVAASIKVMRKLGIAADDLKEDLAELDARLRAEAPDAEASESSVVQDVRGGTSMLPGGFRGVRGYWGPVKGFGGY